MTDPTSAGDPIETDCECDGVGCDDCLLGGDWWDE